MAQVGRISGPLLFANLERQGKDLAFRNDLSTTQLLFLDVNNDRIGVNTGTPSRQVEVQGTTQTTNLIADQANFPNFTISGNTINSNFGDFNLNASEAIVLSNFDNGTIFITDNTIYTNDSNANIDITPNGSGTTEITNDLNVIGDIYTPGNITFDGSITFGNNISEDTVDFNTDVNSDIIPDQTNTYAIGTVTRRWDTLYTNLVNGQNVSTDNLTVGLIDYDLRQGQIFYVAQNGTDSNEGDHIFAPVASIKRALELAADSNGNPVTVYVFPGDYEEETPLVVPSNVTVTGADIRNVNVFPTSYTLSEDVFHLNGESTVQNLTVRDFYFDDNKGYAFRFAPNAVISTRSPYVQNVSVITKGTTITAQDPRGFASGDAGRGAYVDGAELDPSSVDASMLFHSVTFITPGADGLVMTNGVRVEWLNSFTYFANRGLYAFNNSTGRVSQDGSTIKYGAELRSIGSASVYGNYGAVADGADTLMYLIQHNFAYIGAGKDSSNDNSLVTQANEVVEENNGQIHFVTTDQLGTFRVGDNFFVNFETGSTSVDISSLAADSLSGIVITTGADQTIVAGNNVETGNIRIRNGIIESLSGDLNITSATDIVNVNDSTSISGNLSLTGNLSFDGNLNLLGNQTSDTLDFNVNLDQDFVPNQNLIFDLGKINKKWIGVRLSAAEIGDISIYDNVIETNVSNSDLEFRANGTGVVLVPNNLTAIGNFTISGLSTFEETFIVGDVATAGNLALSSDYNNDNLIIDGNLNVTKTAQFEEILIDDNFITTTSSNSDIELRAAGAGNIDISNSDLRVDNNFSSDNLSSSSNISIATDVEFDTANIDDVTINSNVIDTSISNANLELRSTQNITTNNSVLLENNLSVNNNSNLKTLSVLGNIDQTGNKTITGSFVQTGNTEISGKFISDRKVEFESIDIYNNVIETSDTNADLELRANGTGRVLVPNSNVKINNNLFSASIIAGNLVIDDSLELNEIIIPPSIIEIDDNFISTKISNEDLDLRANGSGSIFFENNLEIVQNLDLSGNTSTKNIQIIGDIDQTGDTIKQGLYSLDGSFIGSGNFNSSNSINFENVSIQQNTISTTQSNSNLEIRASGVGNIIFANSTAINGNISANELTSNNIIINDSFSLDELESSTDIQIFDNVITTTNSNSDLELRANGTGSVNIADSYFTANILSTIDSTLVIDTPNNATINSNKALALPTGTTEQRIVTGNPGDIRFNTDDSIFEGFGNAVISFGGVYSDNRLTNVVAHPTNDSVILTVNNSQVGIVDSNGLNITGIQVEDIRIQNNLITTNVSNSDLELTGSGTGELVFDDISIKNNLIKNNSVSGLTFANTGFGSVKFNGTYGVVVPFGNTASQPVTAEVGDTRWNTDTALLETWDGNQYITSAGLSTAITEEEYNDLLLEYTLIFG